MKSLVLAFGVTVLIAVLSSTIKVDAKAFFFFPLNVDYKKDKTNNGYVSTFLYTSPLTGRQYKYASNVVIPPKSNRYSYNYDWSYGNANAQQPVDNKKPENVEKSDDASTTKRTVANVVYKHPPSGSGQYHKKIGNLNVDAEWSYDIKPADGSSSSNTTSPSSTAIPEESTTIATTTDRDLDENEEDE